MLKQTIIFFSFLLFATLVRPANAQINEAQVEAFTKELANNSELTYIQIKSILSEAHYHESIIKKISNAAEKKLNWESYRNIFIKEERIDAGLEFWNEYEGVLNEVSANSGVPVEIILGIIGVETLFGQRKGSYKVLDALYTLAFGYPSRGSFFKSELGHFIQIAHAEKLDIHGIRGSYAGAMGYCQFMPSSYKAYAVSYEKGGTKDLMNSPEDAIASVANYLKVHRWKKDQKIVSKANVTSDFKKIKKQSLKPKNTVTFYSNYGYRPSENISPSSKSTLIQLEKDDSNEYWFGFNNFYVITRYNHSELYAMAVIELGEKIKEKKELVR